jgi:hypothetical protein
MAGKRWASARHSPWLLFDVLSPFVLIYVTKLGLPQKPVRNPGVAGAWEEADVRGELLFRMRSKAVDVQFCVVAGYI